MPILRRLRFAILFSPIRAVRGAIALALVFLLQPAGAADFIVRSNPVPCRVDVEYSFSIPGADPAHDIVVDMPLPFDCQYQDVSGDSGDGEIRRFPETGDPYLRTVVRRRGQRRVRDDEPVSYSRNVVLYDVRADLTMAADEHAYLNSSPERRLYTRAKGDLVAPNHPRVVALAADLQKKAGNSYLEYARLAFEHVAENYALSGSGHQPRTLEKVLETRSGNAADLNSVFVSLLRRRGIPARHVVGRALDGTLHVFAEFYLEYRGWAPADVARRILDPKGEHFGAVYARDGVVVLSRDVELTIKTVRKPGVGPQGAEEETIPLFHEAVLSMNRKFAVIDGQYRLANPRTPRERFSFRGTARR